ncbi:MAG: DUF4175 domain-containing protein, partial [Planctomycetales bacterium]
AAEKGLKQAEDIFNKLEDAAREIAKAKREKPDLGKTLVKLSSLGKRIEERKQQLGDAKKFKQQLDRLKDLDDGPAEKFGKAMKDGDLKKAVDELNNLRQKMQDGELDQKAKVELANQLQNMKNNLQDMAAKHDQMKEDLKKQIQELKKKGQLDKADKLAQQLDNLNQQDPQMKQLEKLAQQLQQCKDCMKQGDMQEAGQQLAQAQENIQEMLQNLEELELMEQALKEIEDAKCKMCQGQGQGQGKGKGKNKPKIGKGLGDGNGAGLRPEAEEKTATRDSKANVKVGSGTAVRVGEGPESTYKGPIREEIRAQIEADRKRESDPLNGQVLPRAQRDHAREYFNKLRKGE